MELLNSFVVHQDRPEAQLTLFLKWLCMPAVMFLSSIPNYFESEISSVQTMQTAAS
jgi:hypothetical protein